MHKIPTPASSLAIVTYSNSFSASLCLLYRSLWPTLPGALGSSSPMGSEELDSSFSQPSSAQLPGRIITMHSHMGSRDMRSTWV